MPKSGAMLADYDRFHGLLYSAAYFRGLWEYRFKLKKTKSKFYPSGNDKEGKIHVQMMSLKQKMEIGINNQSQFQWVKLPYAVKIARIVLRNFSEFRIFNVHSSAVFQRFHR